MVQQERIADEEAPKTAPSPKSRLAMLKRSSAKKGASPSDPFRFQGEGVCFKGKLIGEREVEGARGDAMCAEAMRLAKAAVKAAGTHKQRILLYISIQGLKIVDEKTAITLHNFPVSRVSFIARDTTDARAFGFIFGQEGQYRFYGIKTAQTADHAVLSIRDMFQIVFEMKKKQIEEVKLKQEEKEHKEMQENGVRSEDGVLVADLLDLETELHCLERGVEQLQNIPVFPSDGDFWPGEETPAVHTDAFGQAVFGARPPQPANPFGDSFGGLSSQPQPVVEFSLSPQPEWRPSPVLPLTHSAPNFSVSSLSDEKSKRQETNPFAAAAATALPVPLPVPVPPRHSHDPFDTSILSGVQWSSSPNENLAPTFGHANHSASFTANFERPQPRPTWTEEPRRVTSLEEAFNRLVDMDALVRPDSKKNPFDQMLNPPKVPLNALGTAPPPPRPVATVKDPFNDAFFH